MLLITCPVCAITADETEFSNGGLCPSQRTYMRGEVEEWWRCEGCRSWFSMARHTVSKRITAISAADDGASVTDGKS